MMFELWTKRGRKGSKNWGISLKTQELYALVFLARYLDLFTDFISVYKELDTFRHYFLVGACFALALMLHEKFTFQEVEMICSLYVLSYVTLKSIIQKNFPEEYARRKQEHDSLTNFGVDLLPLFVMDVVMPYQKLPLNIFEP